MQKYLVFILVFLTLITGFSAVANSESAELPAWLKKVTTEKYQQPDAMLALLQQHQEERVGLSSQLQARWYYEQAILFEVLGRHIEQQQAAEQGLTLLAEQQSLLRVKLLYALGFALEMQADTEQAMQRYETGIALATLLDDEVQILRGHINQAAIYLSFNKHKQALALLQDTYHRAQILQNKALIAEVNAELGLLYVSISFEEEGIVLLKTALQLYQELGWQKNIVTVKFNLARTYGFLQQYQLSLQLYNEILQAESASTDVMNLYHTYLGLAITSSASGAGDAAISYINKAEAYLPQLQAKVHIATHHYEKALILQRLKQTSLAMQQLLLAEQSLALENDSELAMGLTYVKSQLLAESGEFERAYQQLEQFMQQFKQQRNEDNELALERMRLVFAQEQQQQQNLLLLQDNELKALRLQEVESSHKLQMLWQIVLGSSTLILSILLIWQLFRRKKLLASNNKNSKQEQA
ncbi:tetratricopeptide repeat protein [Rheinheimera salexigens]|uniref:hypothetical protein n=1 Tax=Rheinheimera salexigens TaxID=1628148 RepID=UPI00114D284F|nr:hypothetical protein [Rheinheimera salexigens]